MKPRHAKRNRFGSKKRNLRASQFSPERLKKIVSQIRDLVEPVCTYHGMELVHVECQREPQGRIIRLYIDKPGGVMLDDCVLISRQADELLELELDLDETYTLEVSSPGAGRPLGRQSDFERFKGNRVKITTAKAICGQRNFTGVLSGISEGAVNLTINDKAVAIPFTDINRARLVSDDGENRCLSQI